ncbi:MAG: hypothetical protein KDK97_03550 [Verrucomicrobiales bacterium]|nr:hypothetical protein [Verrucomicrobiales bacterium]MCP5558696.1 hypothetical protein [Verrucomicrobiaceae bacterium]
MMKRNWILILAALAPVSGLHAEPQNFAFDCEAWQAGEPPKEDVYVVEGKFAVTAVSGNKVLQIDPAELVDATAQLAVSGAGPATVHAKIFASKAGRSYPRFGVGVHGMSGHRLMMNPARKVVELMKGDEVITSAPIAWTSDAWVNLKLEATKGEGDTWKIAGKVWAADAMEPAEPTVTADDAKLKGQGKVSIWGAPYSGTPILFDELKVQVEIAPK